jgi:Histidine kinase-, DNA gyrase B-, and HSP90-like ATPase
MTASPEEELILTFHHEVVEHLGLKLYQNRPTNVIAELVSNSWDVDASNVWIDITAADPAHESLIAVADNGCGMTFSDVRGNYLVIGMPKRDRPACALPAAASRWRERALASWRLSGSQPKST